MGLIKVSFDTNCVWNFKNLEKISAKSAGCHKIEREEEEDYITFLMYKKIRREFLLEHTARATERETEKKS